MSGSEEVPSDVDGASCPSRCSTVLAAIAEAKAEIQAAFDEANRLYQTERNQSFYEGQHHAYKYAFLVLGQLEWKVVSELDQ